MSESDAKAAARCDECDGIIRKGEGCICDAAPPAGVATMGFAMLTARCERLLCDACAEGVAGASKERALAWWQEHPNGHPLFVPKAADPVFDVLHSLGEVRRRPTRVMGVLGCGGVLAAVVLVPTLWLSGVGGWKALLIGAALFAVVFGVVRLLAVRRDAALRRAAPDAAARFAEHFPEKSPARKEAVGVLTARVEAMIARGARRKLVGTTPEWLLLSSLAQEGRLSAQEVKTCEDLARRARS